MDLARNKHISLTLTMVIIFIFALTAFWFSSGVWLFISLAGLLVVGLYKYELAIVFYIAMLPVWPFLGGLTSTVVSMGVLFVLFVVNKRLLKQAIAATPFLILISIVIFASLFGSLLSGYYEYIHVVGLLLLTLLLSYFLVDCIIKNPNILYYVLSAFVVAGLVAGIVSFEASGGDFRRLTLGGLIRSEGGNVRQLANVLGVALILLLVPLKKTKHWKNRKNKLKNISFWCVAVLISVFLLATSSRGVILAVVFSLGYYILVTNLAYSTISFKRLLYSLIVIFTSYILFVVFSDLLSLDNSILLMAERFDEDAIEGGLSSRLRIWAAGLSNMTLSQILFGSGLSSFRYLALQSDVDYYSHSFFVGAFTDLGLLGFVAIIIFIGYTFYLIYKNRVYSALPVLSYGIVSHITHGSLTSQYFWILLALSYAMAVLPSSTSKLAK